MERHVEQNLSTDDSQMQTRTTGERFERGITFEHDMLSWDMKGNTLYNLPQAILFASIAWGGQWLILYFYKNVQGKFLAVYKRSFIVITLAGFALVCCLFFLAMKKIILLCVQTARSKTSYGNLQTSRNAGIEVPTHSLEGLDHEATKISFTVPRMLDEEKRAGVQHSYGRPNIPMIISQILESGDDVGIFLCAPTSLKKAIKGSIGGKQECAIYEEISDL